VLAPGPVGPALEPVMATADDFRRIVLSFPCAEEKAHMGHPDFRIGGKIFATLHGAGAGTGTVMLLPEQQELAIEAEPEAFSPAAGAWGRGGSTLVTLSAVSDEWLERTLDWAWRKRAPAKLQPSPSLPRKREPS
jgi:hypothetical protein